MEFWGAILKAVVYVVVNCYEFILHIIMDLIAAWRRHKWWDRNDPKPRKTN